MPPRFSRILIRFVWGRCHLTDIVSSPFLKQFCVCISFFKEPLTCSQCTYRNEQCEFFPKLYVTFVGIHKTKTKTNHIIIHNTSLLTYVLYKNNNYFILVFQRRSRKEKKKTRTQIKTCK